MFRVALSGATAMPSLHGHFACAARLPPNISPTSRSHLMNAPLPATALDQQCVNAVRFLAVDAVQKANSGHPGLPLGAAPMAYTLWTRLMKFDPAQPHWFDRDRFVLSAGHGSALLYSLLHLSGYDLTMEQLQQAVKQRRAVAG